MPTIQMAAEAFLVTDNGIPKDDIYGALLAGNGHSSRFTQELATQFTDPVTGWTVVDQRINSETGFSGTLFKNKQTDELVIAFRSTEFIDDAARDNLATNTLEIKNTGFAWGQLADMEAWYASLKDGPAKLGNQRVTVTGYSLGGHLATAFNLLHGSAVVDQVVTFNGAGVGKVTQGSLQQSLAEFNALRGSSAQIQNRLSDPALRTLYGTLSASPLTTTAAVNAAKAKVNALYRESGITTEGLMVWYALDEIGTLISEAARVPTLSAGGDDPNEHPKAVPDNLILAESLNYRMAVKLVAQNTESAWLLSGLGQAYGNKAFLQPGDLTRLAATPPATQYDVVGDTSPSAVANSQWHYGQDVRVFIEDQPLHRGGVVGAAMGATFAGLFDYGDIRLLVDGYDKKDFGDTHSLVLLVDSLSVQNVLLQLVPSSDRETAVGSLNTILKDASNLLKAEGGNQGKAEGDVLENVVNALADLLLGPDSGIDLNGSPDGNTWAKDTVGLKNENYTGRDDLYQALDQITKNQGYTDLERSGT